jgi:hypothetical protein
MTDMRSSGKNPFARNSEHTEIMKGNFPSLGPSEGDAMRHVFYADGSIYRGITAEHAETIQRLFDTGLIHDLVTAGLVTASTLVASDDTNYPLLVEHPELTQPNLPTEAPPSMRRDIGIALLELVQTLDSYSFVLRDTDLSGFVIDCRGQPVFQNLAAILPKESRKFSYAEFHANFVGPLRLIDQRPELAALVQRAGTVGLDEDISIRRPWLRWILGKIASLGKPGRRLFDAYYRLIVLSPFGGLLHCGLYGIFIREIVREIWRRKRGDVETEALWTGALLDNLKKRLGAFEFGRVTQKWTDYHRNVDLAAIVRAGNNWKQYYQGDREQALIRALAGIQPGTLLDIGANGGYFSMLGAHLGFTTTAVDYDIGAIDKLYCLLKDAGSPLPIRPFVLDFVALERRHWGRFEADAVFALGFVHHMRRVELLPWAMIAERLSGLTRKVLVTEFKPGTGASHSKQEMTTGVADDYTLEHLTAALEQHFASVEVVGDFTAVGSTSPRTMVVCRRT